MAILYDRNGVITEIRPTADDGRLTKDELCKVIAGQGGRFSDLQFTGLADIGMGGSSVLVRWVHARNPVNKLASRQAEIRGLPELRVYSNALIAYEDELPEDIKIDGIRN